MYFLFFEDMCYKKRELYVKSNVKRQKNMFFYTSDIIKKY